jgi:hypothetical protein
MTLPIMQFLRAIDSGVPAIGKVYYHCSTVLVHLQQFKYSDDEQQSEERCTVVCRCFNAR